VSRQYHPDPWCREGVVPCHQDQKYVLRNNGVLIAIKPLIRFALAKTPKYGLLYNSTFIGRAGTRNKGRISRFLANKCALASRIDCFSETPLPTFGEHLRGQVEDRLKFYESGDLPKKNAEVMKEAAEEVECSSAKVCIMFKSC